ncbi:MAG TPA: GMC family oxidoreductase, partial [Longimicrobiales bacterium]
LVTASVLALGAAVVAVSALRAVLPTPAASETPPAGAATLRLTLTLVLAVYGFEALLPLLLPLLGLAPRAGAAAIADMVRNTLVAFACVAVLRDLPGRLPVLDVVLVAMTLGLAERLASLGTLPGDIALRVALATSALEVTALVALWFARRAVYRAQLDPHFLGTTEYRSLMGLSEVLILGQDEKVPPREIAANVDRYIAQIHAHRIWVHRATLFGVQWHPLLSLKPPLSELDPAARLQHLKAHFQRTDRLIPRPLQPFVQAGIRVCKQLTYVGYYGDKRSFDSIGYTLWEDRPRFAELRASGRLPVVLDPLKLSVTTPETLTNTRVDADVCIIGSGAAGGILAYHLAQQGKSVVVLERGAYVEPRRFDSDEVGMIGKLYADGIFQQTTDYRFTVLQGSCVGGSTVVNNAVSFRTPELVLERWNRDFRAGIEGAALFESAAHIEQLLDIGPSDPGPRNPDMQLNPSAVKYLEGVRKLQIQPTDLEVGTVRTNIHGCFGCGYCNIGCRYSKKLSMLQAVFPEAQRLFGERVRIFSEAEVGRIEWTGNGGAGTATSAIATLPDDRTLTVNARSFVVSAGTIASSFLLMNSGIGKGLPVGQHVSFNMGAPITADFEDELDAYDGLQISHYGLPRPERGFAFETWFNPPVSQALNMPGWFEDHYRNMQRYSHLMAVGVLVGTERGAVVKKALTGGPDLAYTPSESDLAKLADGLIELGQILFAAGAKRCMLNGWNYHEFTSPDQLDAIRRITADRADIALGTGHPQGGNAVSTDPALGVVDPHFRVHGMKNLYVCDASVIPSSLTVNPQLTVMSLAHYASRFIDA